MKRNMLVACVCLLSALVATTASAGKFDPLFRIVNIKGECQIKQAGTDKFVDAKADVAYKYGSTVKTLRNSSCIILLSDGNQVTVEANAELVMQEDVTNPKLRKIDLGAGKIEVELEKDFATNNEFRVETAAAICGAISCKFSVNATNGWANGSQLSISIFGCLEGKINIGGSHFLIPQLSKDDWVTVSTDEQHEYTRVKNVKGNFQIQVKDSSGQPVMEDLKGNHVLKIWARPADIGNNISVALYFESPENTVLKSHSYTEPDTRPSDVIKKSRQAKKEQPKKGEEEGPGMDDGELVTTTTTTTTTVLTTTTTIPSPTPVGRR